MANLHDDHNAPGFNNIRNSEMDKREKKSIQRSYAFLGIIILTVLLVATLLVTAIGAIIANVADKKEPSSNKPVTNASGKDIQWVDITYTADDTYRGALALVNADHKYVFPNVAPEQDEDLEEIYAVWYSNAERPYQLSGISKYMNKDALSALDKMLTAFAATTDKKNVQIRDAYRSFEQQQALLSSSTAAGYSDHHTGYGCALRYTEENVNGSYALSSNEIYNWLYDNCDKYGFVIRYPEDKTDKTGVSDYTEYFRYVGPAHAAYMTKNDLCLEEYVEILKGHTKSNPLEVKDAAGAKYLIYYTEIDGNTKFPCPTNFAYTLSGTNEGGLVVTVDLSKRVTPPTETGTGDANPADNGAAS